MAETKEKEAPKEEEAPKGPDIQIYSYGDNIKTPGEMKMEYDPDGSWGVVGKDMDGIAAYINALTQNKYGGDMNAAKSYEGVGGPMGNRYAINTGGKCEAPNGEKVDRYKVIDNLPPNNLGKYRGLIPGMAANVTKLNPLPIMMAFIEPTVPKCTKVKVRLFNKDNTRTDKELYVSDKDINDLDPCVFAGFKNPLTEKGPDGIGGTYANAGDACKNNFEEFTTLLHADENDKTPGGLPMNYGGIPNDMLSNIYILGLSFFGIYMVKKLTEKK